MPTQREEDRAVSINVNATIPQLVEKLWRKYPDAPSVILGERVYTRNDIREEALRFASGLRDHPHFRAGNHVAIVVSPPNIPHSITASLGIQMAGGIPVIANVVDWNSGKLAHILKDCDAKIVVTIDTVLRADENGNRVLDLSDVVRAIESDETSVQSVVAVDLREIVPRNDWVKRLGLTALWWESRLFWHRRLRKKAWRLPWRQFLENTTRRPAHEGDPNDIAVLLYTSGTSGEPKGVPLTHRNLISNVEQCDAIIAPHIADLPSEEVRVLAALPFYHTFGFMTGFVYPTIKGHVSVLVPKMRDVGTLHDAVVKRGVVVFLGVPYCFRKAVKDASRVWEDLDLRIAVNGSDALKENDAEAFRRTFGVYPIQGYGLTETSPVLLLAHPGEENITTVGSPLPETKVLLVNPERPLLEASTDDVTGRQEGILVAQGPQIMQGYRKHLAMDQPFTHVQGHHGPWFVTGDRFVRDRRGNFFFKGRYDRQFKDHRSEKVVPEEAEQMLEQHPEVELAVAVRITDGRKIGLCAGILPVSDASSIDHETIVDWCRSSGRTPIPLATIVIPRDQRDRFFHISGKKLFGAFQEHIEQQKILQREE